MHQHPDDRGPPGPPPGHPSGPPPAGEPMFHGGDGPPPPPHFMHHEYRGDRFRGRGEFRGEFRGDWRGGRGRGDFRGPPMFGGPPGGGFPGGFPPPPPFPIEHIAPEDDENSNRTLFVGNIDIELTEEDLKRIFERFGVVEAVNIKQTANMHTYAFIKFLNVNQAHVAKMEMSGKLIGRNRSRIGYGKILATNCVWVGGIGYWLSRQEIKEEFKKFGRIVRFTWSHDADHCYVVYDRIMAARNAVQIMRGFVFPGTNVRLRTDFSEADTINEVRDRLKEFETRYTHLITDVEEMPYMDERKSKKEKKKKRRRDDSGSSSDDSRSSSGRRRRKSRRRRRSRSRSSSSSASSASQSRSSSVESAIAGAESVKNIMDAKADVWTGRLALKNTGYPLRMHLLDGRKSLLEKLSGGKTEGDKDTPGDNSKNVLHIKQRLRMEKNILDQVEKKMSQAGSRKSCVFVGTSAEPAECGEVPKLKDGNLADLVSYLRTKDAAGIVSFPVGAKAGQEIGFLHIFPPCKFAHDYLKEASPKLAIEYSSDECVVLLLVRV